MNSHNKIYDIEVTPPAGAWNNIARELDNLEAHQNISERLTGLEISPPVMAWTAIADQLDITSQEEDLATKLYNAEAPVPPMAWNAISRELDDQKALEIIEKKLSNIQVNPPNSAWVHIIKELEGKKSEPALVVPMNHGWLKYAAAACFIVIVSISAFFILSDGHSDKGYTAGTGGKPDGSLKVQNAIQTNGAQQAGRGNRQQQALAGIRTKLGNAYSASNERNADLQNRYIILMTQDGNIVRMSKKVSNMADCIAGEDHSCDDQISKWQKEMASSNAASSPDNILDLLDMASGDITEAGTAPNM
ncbi:hypothetical protein U0035_19855 [Niabella yanshanensis]|uniref:Uncharacterized protein n=1 Tax=Niabella yanshanensis TaxID=577386 RepID=A0ABZ0W3S6_9BACT|nr:hypothetical protein [Niabella yanshanensis]WQD37925.1 hypothetical protein U0035_19855 [Niabella yanshanensis]